MTEIPTPTCEEIWEGQEDTYLPVSKKLDDSWRHGNRVTEVFHRPADDTYWRVHYRKSGDGEANEFREGDADILQVFPHTKTVEVTEYLSKPC
jgi:hypothetical protein